MIVSLLIGGTSVTVDLSNVTHGCGIWRRLRGRNPVGVYFSSRFPRGKVPFLLRSEHSIVGNHVACTKSNQGNDGGNCNSQHHLAGFRRLQFRQPGNGANDAADRNPESQRRPDHARCKEHHSQHQRNRHVHRGNRPQPHRCRRTDHRQHNEPQRNDNNPRTRRRKSMPHGIINAIAAAEDHHIREFRVANE
jgi:hypothetical protein